MLAGPAWAGRTTEPRGPGMLRGQLGARAGEPTARREAAGSVLDALRRGPRWGGAGALLGMRPLLDGETSLKDRHAPSVFEAMSRECGKQGDTWLAVQTQADSPLRSAGAGRSLRPALQDARHAA